MASENAGATSTDAGRRSKGAQSVVSRVLSLSIFFIGIGVFAAAGFAMVQLGTLADVQLTYFTVGTAVGIVGLLLWIATR